MNNGLLSTFLGFVLPPFIDLINKKVKNGKARFGISLGVPLVLGVLLSLGDIASGNVESILYSGGIIFASAQTVYKLYWKDSTLRKKKVFSK